MPLPELTRKAEIALVAALVLAAAIPLAWVGRERYRMASLLEDVKGGDETRTTTAIEELSRSTSRRWVREIIAAFDDETQNRRNLITVLVKIGPPAVGPLIERLRRSPQSLEEAQRISRALDGESDNLRDTYSAKEPFAEALGRIGAPAVDALKRTMTSGDVDTRRLAAQALERIGKPAVGALLEALHDGDAEVRSSALFGLLRANYPEALSLVLARLKDPSEAPEVKAACCTILESRRDPAAFSALAAALDDPNKDVARAAVWHLLLRADRQRTASREQVIDALASHSGDAAAASLASVISTTWFSNAGLFFTALEALAANRNPSGKEAVATRFRKVNDNFKARFGYALEICDSQNGRAIVDTRVSPAEVEGLARDYRGSLRCDESSDTIGMLLLALERHGSVAMANAFCRSNNSYLSQGALFWAGRKGVTLETTGATEGTPEAPEIETTAPTGPRVRIIDDYLPAGQGD